MSNNSNKMDEWVELLFTYDAIEADIVKNILEAENIDVAVRSFKITPYPVSIGKIGEVRLLVKNSDLEKARGILNHYEKQHRKETDDH